MSFHGHVKVSLVGSRKYTTKGSLKRTSLPVWFGNLALKDSFKRRTKINDRMIKLFRYERKESGRFDLIHFFGQNSSPLKKSVFLKRVSCARV